MSSVDIEELSALGIEKLAKEFINKFKSITDIEMFLKQVYSEISIDKNSSDNIHSIVYKGFILSNFQFELEHVAYYLSRIICTGKLKTRVSVADKLSKLTYLKLCSEDDIEDIIREEVHCLNGSLVIQNRQYKYSEYLNSTIATLETYHEVLLQYMSKFSPGEVYFTFKQLSQPILYRNRVYLEGYGLSDIYLDTTTGQKAGSDIIDKIKAKQKLIYK